MITTPGKSAIACLLLALGCVGVVRAAAPTITSATDVDIYFNPQVPGDSQFAYRIVTADPASSFEASGLPQNSFLNPTTGWINGNRSTPGRYDVTVRATNREGTDSAVVHLFIHPAVIGVKSSEGAFHPGQKFSVTLHYNAPMIVTGTPTLALVVGAAGAAGFREAQYVSGSGTNELVFEYSVAADDYAPNGVQLLPRAPAGGLISDTTGLAATPTLPLRYFALGITIAPDTGLMSASHAIEAVATGPNNFVAGLGL